MIIAGYFIVLLIGIAIGLKLQRHAAEEERVLRIKWENVAKNLLGKVQENCTPEEETSATLLE